MTRLALLALALSGCVVDPEPWGRTALTVHGDVEFVSAAIEAAFVWDAALYDRCGQVFWIVEDGGRPVRQYSVERWKEDGYEGKYMGWFDGDEVAVRDTDFRAERQIVVHELGHALGLGHVSRADDPRSVMFEVAAAQFYIPTAGDVERAAAALGCP